MAIEKPLSTSTLKTMILDGLQEIIGTPGLQAVLNLQKTLYPAVEENDSALAYAQDLSQLQLTLETMYGPRGGQGIILRTGRVFYKGILRQYSEILGFMELDYRMLPKPRRIEVGLEAIATWLKQSGEMPATISAGDQYWYWRSEHCVWCHNRHNSDQPVCHFTVGMLQEFLFWVSGGKVYPVLESECCAMGAAACVVQIGKKPLE